MRALWSAVARILDRLLVCEGARSGAASGPLHVLPGGGEASGLPQGASPEAHEVSWGAQLSPDHGPLCSVLPEPLTRWREVNVLADWDVARVAGGIETGATAA